MCGCVDVCMSSLQRWSLFLLVGFTDRYNHTYSESLWWKLFKNHQRTQIQRQRQWQRQRQRQRHRKSAWNTHLMLYFWNPDDSLIPNMMIDTSPWSSCSSQSPWLPCSGHTVNSTGPSVSPFRDFLNVHKKDAKQIITKPYFGDPACKIWDSARPALHPWLKQLTAECLTNWNICKLKY